MKNDNWEIVEGKVPVLLVAAHNFPHIREGNIKARDIGTGDMVKKLCQKFGTWGMITTAIQTDPNWHHDAPFRLALKELVSRQKIMTVIDFHGRKEEHPRLLEYYPNQIFRSQFNLDPAMTRELIKGGQFTLPKDLELDGISCLAIEIRKDGRVLTSENPKSFLRTRETLNKLITTILEPRVGLEPTT